MSNCARLVAALLGFVVASCQPEAVTERPPVGSPDTASEGAAGDSAVGVTTAPLIVGNYTYTPSADTVLRSAIPYGNDGTGTQLGVTSLAAAEIERSIVRFNQSQIRTPFPGTHVLQSARLDIFVSGISAGWLGGAIDIHAMNREWTEGTGLAGNGASWVCANDTNTTWFGLWTNNCSSANNWSMTTPAAYPRPFNSTATDRVPVFTGGLTRISFDVTADVRAVRAGATHYGWMLAGAPNLAGGEWLTFASREAGVSVRPQLIINYGTDECPTDPNKGLPGACGCGNPDLDTNLDNVADCFDAAVPATGDTAIRLAVPFGNDGTGLFLPTTAASIVDIERSLIKVSNGAIDAARHGAPVTKAYLELTVAGIAVGWAGGQIAIHRMKPQPDWVEGTGLAGHGATWACADDWNTTVFGLLNDCIPADDWYMSPLQWTLFPKPYLDPATAIVGVSWPGMTSVRFDVTADVHAFLADPSSNNGWIVQGNASNFLSGNWINFGSRESGAPPRLLIELPEGCPTTGKVGGPGACGCAIPDTDRDGDGTPDCIDECPDENPRIKRGACGCDDEPDDDNDGLANCIDPCPNHGDPTLGGACGCPGPNAAPPGTLCEGPCGGDGEHATGFDVCDGEGHCGDVTDPVTCPSPDPTCSDCEPVVVKNLTLGGGYSSFWTCKCARGGDFSSDACSDLEGFHLVRIDSPDKNAFLRGLIDSDTWIGANDRSQDGEWRWASALNNDGERFWDGNASGSAVGGRYENWQSSEPGGGGTEACAAMSLSGGLGDWQDRNCGEPLDFICERGLAVPDEGGKTPDFDRLCVKLGTRCPPWDLPECIDESELPGGGDDILDQQAQVDACEACTDACDGCDGDCPGAPPPDATAANSCRTACLSACTGAAEEPDPATSVACVDDLDNYEPESAIFTDPQPEKHCPIDVPDQDALGLLTRCDTHAQCQAAGKGSHCGEIAHCRLCDPETNGACIACNGELEDMPPAERPNPPDPSLCTVVGTGETNENICVTEKFCGEPNKACFIGDTDPVYCAHYELCVDPENDHDLPGPANPALLEDPIYVTPEVLFPTIPEVQEPDPYFPEDEACSGDTCVAPKDASHPWCHYQVTEDLVAQEPTSPFKPVDTGTNTILTFNVDPGVDLTFETDNGPLGLPLPVLGASARFLATGDIYIFGVDKSFDLINIRGGALGGISFGPALEDRVCGFKAYARAEILGLDVLPEDVNFRWPDDVDDEGVDLQERCLEAVDEFRVVVDSARKAFADAREVVRQYREMKAEDPPRFFSDGTNSTPSLCEQLAMSPPRGFPVLGDCETEHPALTVNRFIQFYNHVTIQRVRDAAAELGEKVDDLVDATDYDGRFAITEPIDEDEQITLFNSTFLIGPVPANLEVLLTTQYGVDAYVIADFRIGRLMENLVGSTYLERDPIFKVGLEGGPAAGIGLSLFAGVGFDFGFASAKLGIDGAIDLGQARVPVTAWAGVGVQAEEDPREPPESWGEWVDVDAGHLIPTQRLVFNLMWDYQSDLHINHVLSGSLGLALKIKFFFFSKRWRKTIISFDGLCPTSGDRDPWCDIPLFRNSADNSITWGEIQLPMPFYPIKFLEYLDFVGDPVGTATFDDSKVGKVFYDSLCQCIPHWNVFDPPKQDCFRREDCCGHEADDDLRCFTDPIPYEGELRSQCVNCRDIGFSCTGDDDCCDIDTQYCYKPNGASAGTCQPRASLCDACEQTSDCSQVEYDLECLGGECKRDPNECILE